MNINQLPNLSIISSIVILIVVLTLVWRFISNRRSLPCPSWLSWMVEMDNPFTKTNRASVIIDLLGLQPGMKVLDAGCGPGRLAIPAAKAIGSQGELTALDIQAGMLARVQEKARTAGLSNIRLMQVELGKGKLEMAYYDRAMLVTVLGEIPEQEAALQEIYQALKPGGILSVTEVIFDPHFQSRESVQRVAGRVGFREAGFFGKRLAYTMHFE
ncbi:MAG: methyltransferase domain-containing protein, partial [Gammaproteobacteria bacterium]|nr:methyltransferase domain-containing protein [Gammaproteobacteria bacterium]